MEFEFDKEIDALLRQTAQSEATFIKTNPKSQIPNPKSFHLDADEISAFAENALPERAKQRYMIHLADCDDCRKKLSNLILLNSDAPIESVPADAKPLVEVSSIPWYRKLFAFPNLAYTMGALVLVFSGIVAYTLLQGVGDSRNAEVSQTYEKQPTGKGMSSDGDVPVTETYSSNTMMSNTASTNSSAMNTAATASNSAVSSAPITAANTNSISKTEEAVKDLKAEPKALSPAKEALDLAERDVSVTSGPPPPPPAPARENEYQTLGEVQKQQAETQNSIAQNQTQIMPDSRNVQRAPMATQRADNKRKAEDYSRDDAAGALKSAPKNDATRVGGKTFNRENNVWYDSAYRGQATKNVTRGTNEYKKLDSGLRAIAENLGGTVVIVWKNKAYRIQ